MRRSYLVGVVAASLVVLSGTPASAVLPCGTDIWGANYADPTPS